MKPPPFLYLRPRSLAEALDALREQGDEAKVLAGGQSLVPLLNFRLARPSVLIDLSLLDEIRGVSREDGELVIGALTLQREVERSSAVDQANPLLPQALRHVGHLQIRNRGTVGGSIAHADPAAELPAVSLATGALMVAEGPEARRSIPAAEFFVGPFMTALAPDEILVEIRIPAVPDGARTAFMELARRSGDFALAGVAALNHAGPGDGLAVALAGLGVGGTAVRLSAAEEAIRGRPWSEDLGREAGAAAAASVEPFSDVHADAGYRREVLAALVGRVLKLVA